MSDAAELLVLPAGFAGWNPVSQAALLAALTLISEDAVAIGSALLSAVGALEWPTAFLGTFFGIWIGDALLYGVARGGGRALIRRPWARRFVSEEGLAASEQWFAKRGLWALLLSRFIPGTRLPTYLAAGFLRMPFGRFLAVTAGAGVVWCVGVFCLAFALGPAVEGVLLRARNAMFMFPVVLVGLWIGIALVRRIAHPRSRWRLLGFVGRWWHWEFWPPWLFYAPVALYYGWLALRFRSWTLPTLANPGMTHGGMVGESKYATLRELAETSPDVTAASTLLDPADPLERLARLDAWMAQARIEYPLVLKPDWGQRGVGVRVIRTRDEATRYFAEVRAPLVAQEYIPGPFEAGIFYVRHPNGARGHIFAITEKVFPHLVGDGIRSIEELIWRDPRARCVARRYLARLKGRTQEVLAAGETLRLVEAGNHAQGCVFRDGADWWSTELETRIDQISQALNGFHFGRYDLRFTSVEELRAGRGFHILELNGASAEATGIYDARNSLFSAYRTLFRQWRTAFAIGGANRDKGLAPTPLPTLVATWREATRHFAICPAAD